MSKGDVTDVEVTFPEEYFVPELAGKEAVFKVNIQDVKVKELPELTDEYVAANSEFKTVEEMRANFKERMQKAAEENAKVNYENALIDAAVANAKFEVPEIMVEDRISQMVEEMKMSLESRKMSLDMYMQYTGMDMEKSAKTNVLLLLKTLTPTWFWMLLLKLKTSKLTWLMLMQKSQLSPLNTVLPLTKLRKSLNPMAPWACCWLIFYAAKLLML